MTLPTAPADAYYEMAELLGPGWFLTQPPDYGVHVIVEGRDRVLTEWAVTFEESVTLKPLVHASSALRWVGSRPYSPRKENTP